MCPRPQPSSPGKPHRSSGLPLGCISAGAWPVLAPQRVLPFPTEQGMLPTKMQRCSFTC